MSLKDILLSQNCSSNESERKVEQYTMRKDEEDDAVALEDRG